MTATTPFGWLTSRANAVWAKLRGHLASRRKPDPEEQFARALDQLLAQE